MRKELLTIMREQKKEGFVYEDIDINELLEELIKNIGHPDPRIRDELIYPNLAHLLYDKHFEKEKLIAITERLIGDDFLFYDMQNIKETSVLKRSFTTLQLVILLYVHNRDKMFDELFFKVIFNRFMEYFKSETVLAGYNPKYGWLHTIAHSADLFAQFFQSKEFTTTDCEIVFEAIADKFIISDYQFVSDEDERLVTAMLKGLDSNKLSNAFLLRWLDKIADVKPPKTYPEVYHLKTNKKNLLRSLYFRILHKEQYQFLVEPLVIVITEIEKRR